ncbi:AsmA family protein [Parahaliea mediterranea]|uniref:AsmA family protein n=1 Tax=Parahaliea mediterranea TaxID=651086 RepID=A0A939ILI0_9GAMM|nr:AsmA family protein [Parahaliea mediterranea]MBN7796515.1 AsmA family protein [Parahaliea mediterranea]
MPRVLLYLIAVPVLLVVAAALLIPLLVDEDRLMALAADTLEQRTGATLTVNGGASFSLLPRIALELDEVELALPGEAQPDLSARSLDIGVQLMPLFSGKVEIEALLLKGLLVNVPPAPKQPAVDTSEMSDAELDAYYTARREALTQAGRRGGAGDALALPMALEVGHLSLANSRVVLLAEGNGEHTVIDIDRLEASDLNLEGRPVPFRLALILPRGDGVEPVKVALETTFTLDAQAQALTLPALSATVSGATTQPLELSATGTADLQRLAADLDLQLTIGAASGQGKVRYATFESPQIDADLHFNQLSPALLALAGPDAASEEDDDDAQASGDEPLPLDALRAIDSRVDLRVDTATVDAHDIHDLQLKLRAVDGVLRVNRLSGQVHGGELSMSATIDGKHNSARLDTKGSVSGLDIPQLLRALEAEPTVGGKANLNWELASSGATANALRRELHGPIALHTSELVLHGMGIERMLCKTVALVNREQLSADLPEDSAFEALTVDIQVEQGVARLAPLRAELPHVALTGTGDIDLETQGFEAVFKARLDQGLSEMDPACRVNERFTAIDWPVNCAGSLGGDPGQWCKVDSGEIVEELTKNEVQRKVQKEAGRLFDKLLNKDKGKE